MLRKIEDKFRSFWTFLLLIFFCVTVINAADKKDENCLYPSDWGGQWFQSGRGHLGPVHVNRTHFFNGLCIEVGKVNRFVVYLEQDRCHKCMVINMKHFNVIQYKESYCDSSTRDLRQLCRGITGDATLYSMFRLDAKLFSCPFKGPLTFTYSKGYGECKDPVSQVDSCADDSRLLFRQQACADVPKSESKEEELICLGDWKEGSNNYLVGKVNHAHANTDEDRYRCFIFERPHQHHRQAIIGGSYGRDVDHPTLYLSMSADATCQGLVTAHEGGKTMKLNKENHGSKKCKFPSWLSENKHWHTLDFSQSYFVLHHNTSLKISNGTAAPENLEVRSHTDLRLVCHEYESYTDPRDRFKEHHKKGAGHQKGHHDHSDDVTIIVHFTVGCRSGYRCMRIFRRDNHVVQIQFGSDALNPEESCNNYYWNAQTAQYVTLVAARGGAGADVKGSCGPLGQYHVPPLSTSEEGISAIITTGDDDGINCDSAPDDDGRTPRPLTHLTVGCPQYDILEMHETCPKNVKKYQCHGEWQTNGVTYVVASPISRPSRAPRRICFAYTDVGDENSSHMMFVARHDTCIDSHFNAHYNLNTTLVGQCPQASGIQSPANRPRVLAAVPLGSLLVLFYKTFSYISLRLS